MYFVEVMLKNDFTVKISEVFQIRSLKHLNGTRAVALKYLNGTRADQRPKELELYTAVQLLYQAELFVTFGCFHVSEKIKILP